MTSLSLLSENILLAAEECQLEAVVGEKTESSLRSLDSAMQNIKVLKVYVWKKLRGFDH